MTETKQALRLKIDEQGNLAYEDGNVLAEFVPTHDKKEHFEQIVRAVNSHEELINALFAANRYGDFAHAPEIRALLHDTIRAIAK